MKIVINIFIFLLLEANDEQQETIGERIVKLRNSLKMSQNEFAKLIGFDQSYLSYIERNKKEVSFKLIKAMIDSHSKIKNVSLNWILLGIPPPFLSEQTNTSDAQAETLTNDNPMEELRKLVESMRDELRALRQEISDLTVRVDKLEQKKK